MSKEICNINECNGKTLAKGLCRKHYNQQYNKNLTPEQKEKRNARIKKYRETEKGKEAVKRYNTSDKCKQRISDYLKTEKGQEVRKKKAKKYQCSVKGKEASQKYCNSEKGKEANRKGAHIRRARKRSVEIENFDSFEIFERDEWVCKLCGKQVDKNLKYPDPLCPSLDHIIPLSKNGPHTRDNVQLAHLFCNLSKHDKIVDYK